MSQENHHVLLGESEWAAHPDLKTGSLLGPVRLSVCMGVQEAEHLCHVVQVAHLAVIAAPRVQGDARFFPRPLLVRPGLVGAVLVDRVAFHIKLFIYCLVILTIIYHVEA